MKEKTDLELALKHKYRVTPGGPIVPGVTSVIGIADKPTFKWAASGIGAQTAWDNRERFDEVVRSHREWLLTGRPNRDKQALSEEGTDEEVYIHFCRGEFQRQWDAKAERGNRVHAVAEAWAKGESPETMVEDSKLIDALERFYRDYRPRALHVECIVLNEEHQFGGRGDEIVELDGPNAQGVFFIDYKTTADHYHYPVALQETAYMHCGLARYDELGMLLPIEPLPKLDGSRVVYLREDGTAGVYDPFEVISEEDAWAAFLTSLGLFNLNRKISNQLKEAGAK